MKRNEKNSQVERKIPLQQVPTVGRVVEIDGIGKMLCDRHYDGHAVFVGKEGGDVVIEVTISRDHIIQEGDCYKFTAEPTIQPYSRTTLGGGEFRSYEQKLRSAKL